MENIKTREELPAIVEMAKGNPRKSARAMITMDLLEMLQLRASNSPEIEEQYAAAMNNGDVFPPVKTVLDPDSLACYCYDGAHRLAATHKNGRTQVQAEIVLDSKRDALLLGAGENDAHGLRRSNADKRHAVEILLADEECARCSSTRLAGIARVSVPLVEEVRQALEADPGGEAGRLATRVAMRGGKAYAMKVPAKAPKDPVTGLVARFARAAEKLDAASRRRLVEKLCSRLTDDTRD